MKKIFYSVLFLTATIYSQGLPLPKNIQSPNSANLGKYGDAPVSFYTGNPIINIPLYTMNELGVQLDVSLDYDGSGVRVTSLPSWVGQNWSLNAGGAITRSVNGLPDEFHVPQATTIAGYGYAYPISYQRLNVPNWTDLGLLTNIYMTNRGYDSTNTVKDSQPDIFTFNFMGHSGKFFMGEDGQWKVASSSNLRVLINLEDTSYPFNLQYISNTNHLQTKLLNKIELIDDKGIIYTFGNDPAAIEYSVDFFGQRYNYWHGNSWYLTKVRNHYGKVLYTLQYERGPYIGEFYNHSYSNVFHARYEGGLFQGSTDGCYFSYGGTAVQGTLISPVYLKKIIPLSGKELNFNRQDNTNRVYNTTGPLQQAIYNRLYTEGVMNNGDLLAYYFYHLREYQGLDTVIAKLKWQNLTSITGAADISFQSNRPNYPGEHIQRYNLKGVTVEGRAYKFEYDRFELLPEPISKAIDHLGYYNGTEYITTNGPAAHYAQRNTNADLVKVGSLKKIIYPTKGSIEFVYGPHKYSQYVSDDRATIQPVTESIIGGLRIEQIKTDDSKGNIEVKIYKYIKNYSSNPNGATSSGILSNLPKYYWTDWRTLSPPGQQSGYLSENVFTTNPIIPLGNFFGSPIGYSEVAEVLADGSYTLYKFTNNEDPALRDESFAATFNVSTSPYEAFNDKSLLRGKLKERMIYDINNQMIEKSTMIYSTNNGLSKFVKGSNVTGVSCASLGYGFNRGNAYKIYYFDYNMIKEEKISFLEQQPFRTSTSFSYDYYPNLSSSVGDSFLQSTTFNVLLEPGETGNEQIETIFTYPFEFTSAINSDMVSKRVFTELITENKRNGETITKEQIEFGYFSPIINANWLLKKKMLISKGGNALEEKTIIDSYDQNGNICEYHTSDGTYTILVWAYKKRYPIIKIEGPQASKGYAEMKAASVESILNSSTSAWSGSHPQILGYLEEVRAAYPNQLVTTYTYNPSADQIFSITDPKGNTVRYDYDGNKRLIYIKDKDGNITTSYNYNYKNN